MSPYTKAVSSILFPLHERLKGHDTVAVRRDLEASQWRTREQLLETQLQDLRDFLEKIGHAVPFYRSQFAEHGFRARDLRDLGDLQRLPLLDKETIRCNFDALHREGARNLVQSNTGGSSGEPLVFMLGPERVSHDVAAKWRATRWWGVDIGDPEIVLWGSPIELGAQDRVRRLRDRILRTELLPAFEMSRANMDRFLQRIVKRRPRMLFGYPSSLALLAEHARASGVDVSGAGIGVAFVTSERLYPYQRSAIEETFGCPVANGYGGRDAGFIAHECPRGALHVTAEDIVLEVIDDAGRVLPPGETGELVVTHLRTADFPFVRYRTGDIGALGEQPCDCGRGLPILARLEGRSTDFVVAEDGSIIHGLALIYTLRAMPEVSAFRIVQESLAQTLVEVVAREGFDDRSTAHIVAEFRARLGANVTVLVKRVAEIPRENSGKFRYVVSRVEPGV